MPAFPFALPPRNKNDLAYIGPPLATMPAVEFPRAPKVSDVNYPLFTIWRNSNTAAVSPDALGDMWYLAYAYFSGGAQQAKWLRIASGSGPALLSLTGNDAVAVHPDSFGNINLYGLTVTNGIYPSAVYTTSGGANTEDINIQFSTAIAATDLTKVGLASFLNTQFTVDSHGFVSLIGGSNPPLLGIHPDAHTIPGTDPVIADASGNIKIEGGATFSTGTQANPIRTNSLAVNTLDLQIQLAGSNPSSSTPNNFGVSQFDSNDFTVTNGFVQLIGSGPAIGKINVQTGTSPIIPTAGAITFNGATVAAGTNPVRTDGTAVNTMALEVQISQAIASTDATKVGLSNFNSSQFSVDANGFVSLIGSGPAFTQITTQVFTNSGTYTPTSGMQYVIVEVIGGGGGGGGCSSHAGGASGAGAGGAGGGYAKGIFSASTIGASQIVTIGSAGAGGAAGANNGSAGGTSSFGTLMTATGGGGGGGSATGTNITISAGAATGGSSSGGFLNINGGNSQAGFIFVVAAQGTGIGGAGGGSAYFQNTFNNTTGPTGINGQNFGCGGGGGANSSASGGASAGGHGAAGIIICTEFI